MISRSVRHTVIYLGFSVVTAGIGFLSSIILTRLLEPREYGRVGLFLSLLFIVIPMISLSADNLISVNRIKHEPAAYEHFRRCYVSTAYIVFLLVQALFVGLYFFDILRDPIFLMLPVLGLIRFLTSIVNIEFVFSEQPVPFGLFNIGSVLLSLVLTATFIFMFSGNAQWRALAMIVSEGLFVLMRYRGQFDRLFAVHLDAQVSGDIFRFGLPLLLSLGAVWALNESDKVIVAKVMGLHDAGLYTAACTIGGVTMVFNQAITNVLAPKFYTSLKYHSGAINAILRRFIGIYLMAGIGFFIIAFSAYSLASNYLLPEKYAAGREIVFWLLVGGIANGLYRALGLCADFYQLTVLRMWATIFGGGATVGFCFLGLHMFGLKGAAIGVGLGYLTLSLALLVRLIGYHPVNIPARAD
jgi:O-antigen/teichoic acid export membrane protein